jgi:formylglycine-generating enzyme required for sulfatase activity
MGSSHVDWVPPGSFDEYRLVKALGRGSMGQVWLAHDTVLDRLVAVKFIAALPTHEAARQRFLTEARAAARVQHPNIIAVYRVGEIGPRPYLISEYVQGDSLDKVARPIAWPRLLEIAIGLARGLAAAHRRGVLHRDLKPANAILSEAGDVKLLDFGLAKLLSQAPPPPSDTPPDHEATATLPGDPGDPEIAPRANHERAVPSEETTRTVALPAGAPARGPRGAIALPSVTGAGAVMGTPAYMPPEAWRGEPATARSDVYSLGALLYALGAGAPPHRGDSPEAARDAVLARDPPPLASVAPEIVSDFAAVVDRCLRRDPAERFASGDAVREALEALAGAASTAASEHARSPQQRLRPRRAVLIGGVLASVLAFGAARRLAGEHGRHAIDATPAASALSDAPAQRRLDAPALAAAAAPPIATAPGRCPEAMVPVPAGTFQMGSPEGEGNPDEQPPHAVTLPPYCIDRTEVTAAAYAECAAAGGCSVAPLTVNWTNYSPEQVKVFSRWCNGKDRPDHPINCVDWDQAAAYCTWKGKRLPTEAEWEYAARGKDGRRYPWGQAAPGASRLNARGIEVLAMVKRVFKDETQLMYEADDGWRATAPVGSYPEGQSPFGALDMAGNVWEWTADWYGAYSPRAETNPHGPDRGTSRVSRGGGWATFDPNKVRAAGRTWMTPRARDCDLGFRCVREN